MKSKTWQPRKWLQQFGKKDPPKYFHTFFRKINVTIFGLPSEKMSRFSAHITRLFSPHFLWWKYGVINICKIFSIVYFHHNIYITISHANSDFVYKMPKITVPNIFGSAILAIYGVFATFSQDSPKKFPLGNGLYK